VALQARRRSPRILIALATPWLAMFALLAQMHERYLVWAAVFFCAGFGVSIGSALLALAVIFMAWVNMAHSMPNAEQFMPGLTQVVNGMMPGAGWAVVALTAVALYLSVAPEKELLPCRD
jgi:hypothetical protein